MDCLKRVKSVYFFQSDTDQIVEVYVTDLVSKAQLKRSKQELIERRVSDIYRFLLFQYTNIFSQHEKEGREVLIAALAGYTVLHRERPDLTMLFYFDFVAKNFEELALPKITAAEFESLYFSKFKAFASLPDDYLFPILFSY